MRQIFIAAMLAAASATAGCATPYAPQEFDFGAPDSLDGAAYGIVESVREVRLERNPAGLADVFEHAVNPETRDELIVRLHDGRTVTVLRDGSQRFAPGQRVRVLSGGRVDHS